MSKRKEKELSVKNVKLYVSEKTKKISFFLYTLFWFKNQHMKFIFLKLAHDHTTPSKAGAKHKLQASTI